MGKIEFTPVPGFSGLYVLTPAVYEDDRGRFSEVCNLRDLEKEGLLYRFVQENQISSRKGALRGMHFQIDYPQGKLVRVISGRVFDVAVDMRPGSPTRGKWFGVELSAENHKQFYISEGFAHGFLVLSDTAEFCYKVTDFYHPGDEGGLAWNDPAIGIEWPGVTGEYPGSGDPSGYRMADGSPLNINERDRNWKPFV